MSKTDWKIAAGIFLAVALAVIIVLAVKRAYPPKELPDFSKQLITESNSSCIVELPPVITPTITIEETPITEGSFIQVTRDDLVIDIMHKYSNTPTRAKKEIIDAIIEIETTYGINPLITYAVGHVESSWNPYEVHKEAIIDIGGKKLKVNAKGSMGIVYEWWGDKLITAGILTNRADLFDPILSIRAFGFIYNELRNMPMHPSADNKDESALLRYFGGDYKSYLDRIDDKIGSLIASKLYKSK